jgi:rhodanese-related sulfurtransferase
MLDAGQRPLVLDVRLQSSHAESRIPGALWIDSRAVERGAAQLPAADEVVVYCACPNEASAVLVAKQLLRHGYTRVRALHGGIDAWTAAGYALEHAAADAAPDAPREQPAVASHSTQH